MSVGVESWGYIIPTYGLCIRCKSAGPLGTLCPERSHGQFPTTYKTIITRNRLILDAEWMCNEIFGTIFRPIATLTYPDEFYTNATVMMWSPRSNNMGQEIRRYEQEPNMNENVVHRLERLNYFENSILAIH